MKTFKTAIEARWYSKKNPSETVEFTLFWGNGQLEYHFFYVNGKPHGECKSYYDNGRLKYHCFFVDGEMYGESKEYHSNGQLSEHCFYVGGKQHGEYKWYDGQGKLRDHYFFVDGEVFEVDHLKDGSYKSKCILSTLFNGNVCDDI